MKQLNEGSRITFISPCQKRRRRSKIPAGERRETGGGGERTEGRTSKRSRPPPCLFLLLVGSLSSGLSATNLRFHEHLLMVHTLAAIIPAPVMTLRPAHHCIWAATPEQHRRAARVGPEAVAASAAEEMQVCAASLRSLPSLIYPYAFSCIYADQDMTTKKNYHDISYFPAHKEL
ncbi:hypothetical protein E2C01_005958 [Portunus trituberculatus]|uniref:Uncharacterized protein n=1 Tax=Portunus trituberculatus TaxID=210409 RepID=A0A5B7D0I0_PORTR|nr:hypothetical protein [Portunus trituberculatus]